MKQRWVISFLISLVSVSALASSAAATQHRAIFRNITVGKDQKIALGAPLDATVKPLLRPSGNDRYQLREGTFSGAEAITVHLTPTGRVSAIFFDYAAGTDYAARVATYRKLLGEPVLQTTRREAAETGGSAVGKPPSTRDQHGRPREGLPVIYSECAEWLVGGCAARSAP